MEVNDPKFQNLLKLMEDYSDFFWSDEEFRNTLMVYLGRFLETGTDLDTDEILEFERFFKEKIDKMVKEKAN